MRKPVCYGVEDQREENYRVWSSSAQLLAYVITTKAMRPCSNSSQDIEQIEEWNEYGELKEQIEEADEFGASGTSTVGANLAPAPSAFDNNAPSPQRSGPPSRASSETRHISIAEPKKDKDKEAASQKPGDAPGNLIMRQLGAEAAAKASQKKTATSTAAKVPVAPLSTSEQTPVPAVTKLSADAAVDSPETVTEATATKTPNQLAAEGAKRTSVDKIATSESSPSSSDPTSPTTEEPSTEAQLLEARRTSSITKTKSRLSEATPASESETVLEDKPATSEAESEPKPETKPAVPASEVSPVVPSATRKHRGSDVGEASPEEIRALERKLSIKEEPEEDEEEDDDHDNDSDEDEEEENKKATALTSIDEAEKEATKGEDIKKEDAKDASKAGVSVGD